MDRRRGDRPDVVDGLEGRQVGLCQRIDAAKVPGQHPRVGRAHVPDGEARQDFRQAAGLGPLDPGNEVVDLFVGHAVQRQQLFTAGVEPEDVAEVLQQPGIDQLVDRLFAQGVDVHLIAGNEVGQSFAELGGALGVGAVAGGLVQVVQGRGGRVFR